MELLIGAGRRRDKLIWDAQNKQVARDKWHHPVTLDYNDACIPDVVADLVNSLPFTDESFDQLHAYETLEHVGSQGDWRFFFDQFADFWRVLKPGGLLVGTVPWWQHEWAWGDPSHVRVFIPSTFTFLNQKAYEQIDKEGSPMSDFRFYWKHNFEIDGLANLSNVQLFFQLRKA